MSEKIKEFIDRKLKNYMNLPDEIIKDYRLEEENMKGYQGREILELLQNAVDEIEEKSEGYIEICLTGNILRVCNTGKPFSFEGFKSLIISSLSPKYNNDSFIGNKGTGFRSILNWGEEVRVYSGEFALAFSEKIAQQRLAELQAYDSVKNFCMDNDVHMSIMSCPEIIERPDDLDFVTTIEVTLKYTVIDKVREQLSEITQETLIFLPKLNILRIVYDNEIKSFKKIITETTRHNEEKIEKIRIETIINQKEPNISNWIMATRVGKYEERNFNVKAAWTPDFKSLTENRLYCYFRTKIELPINVLAHATLDLSADRNSLIESKANFYILNRLCELLSDLAESNCKGGSPSYHALEMLSPHGVFPKTLEWCDFSFRKTYYAKLANKRIYPTVNGKYISFADRPKFYKENFAKYLCGPLVDNLLCYTDNSEIHELIQVLSKTNGQLLEYTYKDFVAAIDSRLSALSIMERADLWLMFINKYGNKIFCYNFGNVIKEPLPMFALDEEGKAVNSGTTIFFPPDNQSQEFPKPPKFAKLVFFNRDLLEALKSKSEIKNHSRSAIYDMLSPFKNIFQYNLNNIIRHVKSSLENKSSKITNNNIKASENIINDYQIEFLEWLWKLYKNNYLNADNNNNEILKSIKFPDRSGAWQEASKLYTGIDYGNEITEKIFASKTEMLAGKFDFLEEEDKSKVKKFLQLLGVNYFPPIKKIEIDLLKNEKLKYYLADNIKYPLRATAKSLTDNLYNSPNDIMSAYFKSIKINSIENLDKILVSSPTNVILDWIGNDYDLKKALSCEYENDDSEGQIRSYSQGTFREIPGEHLPSYIRYIFSTSKWIEFEGVRYAPSQCLLLGKNGANFPPYLVSPDLNDFLDKSKSSKNLTIGTLRELLINLGAHSDYSSLDTETFYTLLLMLPENDEGGRISRSIYKIHKKGLAKGLDTSSSSYKKFQQKGKVFCKTTGNFEPISEVFYLKDNLSSILQKKRKLIDIYIREDSENIKKYFGVETLPPPSEVTDTPETHSANEEFKRDFQLFIPYAFCKYIRQMDYKRESTQESYEKLAEKFKNIDIELCKSAMVKYGADSYQLGENNFIITKNKIYLCAPSNCISLEDLKEDLEFCSAIADIFRIICESQDPSIYEFARTVFSYSPEKRDQLIFTDFGDLEVLVRPRKLLGKAISPEEIFTQVCEHFNGGKCGDKLITEISKLNCKDLSSLKNAPLLKKILKTLKTEVSEFNAKSGFSINLISYYKEQLKNICEINKKAYKNGLFAYLKDKSIQDKKTFKTKWNDFGLDAFEIENTVAYDCQEAFDKKFGTYLSLLSDIDADEEWKANLKKFKKDKNQELIDELLENPIFNSLLYFGEMLELTAIYNQKEEEITCEKSQNFSQPLIDFSKVPISKISTSAALHQAISSPRKRWKNTGGFAKEKDLAKQGRCAEESIYNMMLANPDLYKNVEWVSENAKKCNVNPDGADGAGYDIKYIDAEGNEKFCEVKSSKGDNIVFIMSENELKVAEENADMYEIWFMASIWEKPHLLILPDLFKYDSHERRSNNKKFLCEPGESRIRCLEVEGKVQELPLTFPEENTA